MAEETKKRTIQVKIGGQKAKSMSPEAAAEYLKSIAGTQRSGHVKMTLGQTPSSTTPPPPKRKDGMPCSEKEMKALMSMFIEIFSAGLNTEKLNQPSTAKRKRLFQFPCDLPPPPGGWPEDLMWPAADDEDEKSVDSLPVLEDCKEGDEPAPMNPRPPTTQPEPVTGSSGIARLEWEALERVAIEDALEQEERARKAAKKQKKPPPKKKPKPLAGDSLAKKREKAVATWKARVSSAVQAADLERLQQALDESPLRTDDRTELLEEQVESLLPHCLPKNRSLIDKGHEARMLLADYILNVVPSAMLVPLRNGRSTLHTACFYADLDLMGRMTGNLDNMESTCAESGWTPLQYAALSGSMQAFESMLEAGCSPSTLTSSTHTWRPANGQGVNVRQLVEAIVNGTMDTDIETHGMAVEEINKDFGSSVEYRLLLERVVSRLKDVESNGYTPRTKKQIAQEEHLVKEKVAKIEKEKKKERREAKAEAVAAEPVAKSPPRAVPDEDTDRVDDSSLTAVTHTKPAPDEDPLMTALEGMGFSKDQIKAGIKACGGADRATADDVVAYIFGQDEGGFMPKQKPPPARRQERDDDRKPAAKQVKGSRRNNNAKAAEQKREEALKRAQEERLAAEQLAAKREEQRRRNREWNKRQETQAMLASTGKPAVPLVAAGASRSQQSAGVGQTSSHTATVPSLAFAVKDPPSESVASPSETSRSRLEQLPPPQENIYITDNATVASSLDIEIPNDDATISTIGSFSQPRGTPITGQFANPPKITQQVVPPGFGQSSVSPTKVPASRPPVRGAGLPSTPIGLPPGIPETQPLVEPLHQVSGFHGGFGSGMQQQPRLAVQETLVPNGLGNGLLTGVLNQHSTGLPPASLEPAGVSHLFAHQQPRHVPQAPPPQGQFPPGFGGLGMMPPGHHAVPVPAPSMISSAPGPSLSSPMGFGLDAPKSQHLESSLIDSISTGSTVVAGHTLWGGAGGGAGTTGSSLLSSLIHEDQDAPESLFSRQPERPHAQWPPRPQESFGSNRSGSGGGNIW